MDPAAPLSPSPTAYSRFERGLLAAPALATLAICGTWVFAETRGLTWFSRYAPLGAMAPVAVGALVLSLAVGGYLWSGRHSRARHLLAGSVVAAVALGAAVLGTRNLLAPTAVWDPEARLLALLQLNATAGAAPPVRLSLFAAASLLLISFQLALHLTGASRQRRWQQLGAALATTAATLLLYAAASRLVGVTLIAVGRFSISFWTAAALGLFNVALAVSFRLGPELQRLLLGPTPSPEPSDGEAGSTPLRGLVPVLLGGMVLTALAVLWTLHGQFTRARRETAAYLSHVAHLHASELGNWRRERFGDARVLQLALPLQPTFDARRESPADQPPVSTYFEAFRQVMRYEAITLLDANGAPVCHAGPLPPADLFAREARERRSADATVWCHDTPLDAPGPVWLDLFASLPRDAPGAAARTLALRIDARPQFAALRSRGEDTALGAETLVLRRNAGGVHYLSELSARPEPKTPATAQPTSWDSLAAEVGRSGEFGLGEFRDYRDIPVLAVAHPVPDSPWTLLVKVDRAAADAPVRTEAWRLGAAFLGVTIALGLGANAVGRKRQFDLERRRREIERERHAAVDRLAGIASRVPGVVYQYQLFPDGRSCFPYASEAIRQIYRVDPIAVRTDASAVFKVLHPDDYDGIVASIQESARTLTPWDHEYRVRFNDGTTRWLHGSAVPRKEPDGSILWHGFISDVTARKRTDEALRDSLREKEALLKEVHHRVKNNLQVVSSLLRMEARRHQASAAAAVLQDMMGRVHSMALLHEALYRTPTFAAVDLAAYLRRIAQEVVRTASPRPGTIALILELEPVRVEMDQALPCGLLLNELVSNACKHGFPSGGPGEIRVTLQPNGTPARWRLRVHDNGVGLPGDLATRRPTSLGLELVTDLAAQLEGRLEVDPGPGATFEVVFTVRPIAAATDEPGAT